MPCSRTPAGQNSADHPAPLYGDFRRVKGVVPRIETFEAQSLQHSWLTACWLDYPVLNFWDYSRQPKALFPVAGLPCRYGGLTRRNKRPGPAALTPCPLPPQMTTSACNILISSLTLAASSNSSSWACRYILSSNCLSFFAACLGVSA